MSSESEPPKPSWPSLTTRRWLFVAFAAAWLVALIVPVPFREPPALQFADHSITFAKTLHVAAYTFFTMLGASMRLPPSRRWLVLVVLFGHALLSEFLQYMLHNYTHRTGKWSDVALDSFGILVGILLTWKWWR